MPFFAHLSTKADGASALKECSHAAEERFGPSADLALLFFSPHHRANAGSLGQSLREQLKPRCFLGCQGETIIGNEREVEQGPALCLWLGRWEGAQLTPFHIEVEPTSEGFSLLGYPDELNDVQADQALIVTLADPFTFPVDHYLKRINEETPGLRVVGGMASGARGPGEAPLLIDDRAVDQGAVAVLLRGPIRARSVVSQGCRPIGKPLVITKGKENVILEVGGRSPLAYLQELWETLSPAERELVRRGLHVGRVISEYQDKFHRGDFLIRNVMAIDRETGAVQITERIKPGQTVQFHVRDAATADEDLHVLLQQQARAGEKAAGALLFSCNGRGSRMFDQPSHDAGAVQAETGGIPLAGFFAQGELGPVGGQNFIHGFTASVVLFE